LILVLPQLEQRVPFQICRTPRDDFCPHVWHDEIVVQFALLHAWSPVVPVAFLQIEQVFGVVQVASSQEWPNDFPSVVLQVEQVLGVVQVASFQE
jgi:hypothetical protein